jgi:uncharacterized protein YbaR (Trm112 family)
MLKSLAPRFVCPTCKQPNSNLTAHVFKDGESGHICDGILICDSCFSWYPIAADVVELLPPALLYKRGVVQFQERFGSMIEGLQGDRPRKAENRRRFFQGGQLVGWHRCK